MQLRAPTKVNLSLNILGKRADGYHALSSCVGFVDVCDVITLSPSNDITITITGTYADDAGAAEDNLCIRAATALQKALGVTAGVHMWLEKNIPVGAGLGGGSSDAACMLRHLPEFWQVACDKDIQTGIAETLGADVPVCLNPKGLWLMEGVGHELTSLDISAIGGVVLAYPNAPTPTKDVYAAFGTLGTPSIEENVADWRNLQQAWLWQSLKRSGNDLQLAAVSVSKQIAEVLLTLETALPEPELARMSGSGACCFALYNEKSQADRLALSLADSHPKWWVQSANWL